MTESMENDIQGTSYLSSSNNVPASKDSLAPLEYLQNQRRGSITDPSLHASNPIHPSGSNLKQQKPRQSSRQPEPGAPSVHDAKSSPSDPRPTSPYIFGDATPHGTDNSNQHIHKLLRSLSTERAINPPSSTRAASALETASHDMPDPPASPLAQDDSKFVNSNQMNVDVDHEQYEQKNPRGSQVDYNMRRHSIVVGQDPHLPQNVPHGTKRKMSSDRGVFPSVGEEIDPQLAGPGVPSGIDMDAPAPKRRGSAIDTQRIAQLSLYDRRNSVDSRGGHASQFWVSDRRDSLSSMFSSGPSYVSGFPGDSSRPPPGLATFAWPANTQPLETTGATAMHNEDLNMSGGPPRTFDTSITQLNMMPPIVFPPDRRMSVPENVATTSTGPTRVLRSRSRPPSRQMRSVDSNNHSGPSSASPEDLTSAPSPAGSNKQSKDGATPYSRSPELRVSHKLAERKRRKEMKDLFDELRDQLPADRGMKASKWEILSKAIDFVAQLKQSHQDMSREIDMLRHELDGMRQGNSLPPFPPSIPPPHAVVYGQGPMPSPYPALSGTVQQHPPPNLESSRPGSSQNVFPSGGGPSGPSPGQNGNMSRADSST